MMRRPWQIWLAFALCLAVAVPAMTWLTLHTLRLDRAEALARRQAELEDLISQALWRMDTWLTPIVGQEVARPYHAYQAFNRVVAETGHKSLPAEVPSPLLVQPSEFVLLHFQLDEDGQCTSPQLPQAFKLELAYNNGTTIQNVERSAQRLDELRPTLDYQRLLASLPEAKLPELTALTPGPVTNNAWHAPQQESIAYNQFVENSQAEQYAQAPNPPQPQQQAEQQTYEGHQAASQPMPQQKPSNRNLDNDLQKRGQAYQNYAQREVVQQRLNTKVATQPVVLREGVSRPIFFDDRLLLARRVEIDGRVVVQGCWLDWPRIRAALVAEVHDLLAEVNLRPIELTARAAQNHVLAGLPVQLVTPPLAMGDGSLSPVWTTLAVAWGGLLLAALAVAGLLMGVVALSERRGAFVSAVTHELRTPLTTFRMYAEMLSSGMVEEPQQQRRYLETLRIEADRLSHLVENVLAYARLERGRPSRRFEQIETSELVERVAPRLADRAVQAEMQLDVTVDPATGPIGIATDPAVVEQILFNLVDNACKYASVAGEQRIELMVNADRQHVYFSVRDHGPGIDRVAARRLFQPFSKSVQEAANSAPGIGLGLALCHRLARQLGGSLRLETSTAPGCTFVLALPRN